MIHISGLDLNNITPFKDLSVDFKEGLTYIRGVNKDSDLARPTGNGADKSRFFSAIPNVVYSSAPLSLRKKARKDMLTTKGSSIGLIVKPSASSPEYEIVQMGSKYTIFEDGKDMEMNTIPRAEAFIKGLFPISEIDFYSRCYISTQRPYALLRDSDSDRLQHIIDIARLDQYSSLQKYFSLQASSIKDNEIRLSVLEQQLLNIKKKLKAAKSSVTKEEYTVAKASYDKHAKQIEKLQTQKFNLLAQQQALQSLLVVERELDELRSKYTFKKAPGVQLKLLRKLKSDAEEWEGFNDLKRRAEKAKTKILQQISEIEEKLPENSSESLSKKSKVLNKELSEVSASLSSVETVATQVAELTEELESLNAEFESLGVKKSSVDLETDYSEHIAEAKLRLKLEALLEHEDADEDSGKCPLCQGDVDFDDIRRIVKGERKALELSVKRKKAQRCLIAINDVTKRLSKLSFNKGSASELKARKKELVKSIELIDENLEHFEELAVLRKQLSAIEKPVKPSCTKPDLSVSDIEEGIELCHEIEKHLKAKNALIENHSDFASFRSEAAVVKAAEEVEALLTTLESDIRKQESSQSKSADTVASYEQYTNTVNVYKTEQQSTQAEIDKLKPSVANKKLVTILSKAYGAKGLRSYAANAYCELLQKNLNHYRDLIFAEPFEFIVEASDTGVAILVDRNNGKPDSVSDVRHLSGAESECFALLCAASLITLTPDSRKLNLIVLDEPTSHMHQVTRELFNQKFVPFLREIVPSVYIITPHEDDCGPNSSEWVVEKRKGISKLIQL